VKAGYARDSKLSEIIVGVLKKLGERVASEQGEALAEECLAPLVDGLVDKAVQGVSKLFGKNQEASPAGLFNPAGTMPTRQ
jgi:hypothetical protein